MKISMLFDLRLRRTNDYTYTGWIRFTPKNKKPRIFHFFVIRPFQGTNSEFAIYTDHNWRNVYAEGIGIATQNEEEDAIERAIGHDFCLKTGDKKAPVVGSIVSIVCETIQFSQLQELQEVTLAKREFNCEIVGEVKTIALDFLSEFESH